ncbi:MAG: MBL fold metallo-hydrolase [Dehalococcoidia bacterium]
MEIVPFVTEALGDSSYMLVFGDEAALIDPQRDTRPYLAAAEARGARIVRVFETHIHNDYISGGPALAALGATVTAPTLGKLDFPHEAVSEGDVVRVGSVELRAVATPGHTFEHTAYFLSYADMPHAVFSGGSLLVGAAGRSDLLGADHTAELTRLQWESSNRLASMLGPDSAVLPTHGAGSFCSVSGGPSERTSRLSLELARNPALTSGDFETFRRLQLGMPLPTPAYYPYMAPINRAGDRRAPAPPAPKRFSTAELASVAASEVPVLDLRARSEYAAAHVPGAIALEECPSLLGYVSWLYPFDTPLALVTYDSHQADRVTGDLFRIGYEHVRGYLPFHEWLEQGQESESLQSVELAGAADLIARAGAEILDVRFEKEHLQSPLDGARQLPIDQLRQWAPTVGNGPFLVVCGSGQRAAIVASYLEAQGAQATPLIRGGAPDLSALADRPA